MSDDDNKRALIITGITLDDEEDEDETNNGPDFTEVRDFDDVLKDMQALAWGDLRGLGLLMIEAVRMKIDKAQADILCRAAHKSVGVGLKMARELWSRPSPW